LSDDNPQPNGTAAPGTSARASRADHVHASTGTAFTSLYDNTLSADGTGWSVTTGLSGYTEYEVILSIQNSAAGDVHFNVNNDTGAKYNFVGWDSTGLALAAAFQQDGTKWILLSLSAGVEAAEIRLKISNVAAKKITGEFNGGGLGSAGAARGGGVACDITDAITRIDVTRSANNFLAGSRLRIRGLA
jgi:hypothetical protein